jgi:hypothetical protein
LLLAVKRETIAAGDRGDEGAGDDLADRPGGAFVKEEEREDDAQRQRPIKRVRGCGTAKDTTVSRPSTVYVTDAELDDPHHSEQAATAKEQRGTAYSALSRSLARSCVMRGETAVTVAVSLSLAHTA